MVTIFMGLNTEPFTYAEKALDRWGASDSDDKTRAEMIQYWEKSLAYALDLKSQIDKAIAEYGECELSWSCTGRTRHEMHAHQWAEAMPEYEFEIGYNYHCVVRKKQCSDQ